ncbi:MULTISPECIES: response regulator [Burkholderiaceae]|uniref:Response regulator receiver n=1 Tax=Caballeronia sordidicola TaxID=196367 RepID=A0A242MNC7_CABSO|nr:MULTISPECIES: response regulator [Burkholderiaceae]OTP72826.1 Response regulator receiver [Caballeronia sordidicola]
MNSKNRAECATWTARHVAVGEIQPRVLVVDDNANAAQALAAYLSFENVECRVAFGGVEAISMATHWLPHVIVMDISMPECNGFQVAFALRNDERTCGIAIIAFTALDESEVRRHLIDNEFDGYCQKGQPPTKLFGLVTNFMH